MLMEAPLTLIIIALTAYASIQGFRQPAVVDKFLFSTDAVSQRREYYRLFTSALVHGDWVRLLFNMASFYAFGSVLERRLDRGSGVLAVIYLAGILGGSMLSLWLHRRHLDYRASGAAGGVGGVIFACIFVLPPDTRILLFVIPMPAGLYAMIFLAASIWGIRAQRGIVGHDAHLGGAIIGLLAAAALYPDLVLRRPGLFAIVLGASLALLVYLYTFPPAFGPGKPFKPTGDGQPARVATRSPRQTKRKQRQEDRDAHDKATMNRLLDKISTSGIDSLSEFERKQLEHISRRMRGPKH